MSDASDPNEFPTRPVTLGALVSLHGVRGAFSVRSDCDPPERLFRYKPLWLELGDKRSIVTVRKKTTVPSPYFLVEFEQFADRDSAVTWLGASVLVDRSVLPKPKKGEYYWTDLIGLQVRHVSGQLFGPVVRMLETGANDVLVVQGPEREHLIPYLPGQYVLSVDLEAKLIEVDWDFDF